jgi:glycosyltransferase involved in cell wall biosynthesis
MGASGRQLVSDLSPIRPRVLHCPWNIAGNPAALARFERQILCDSHSVTVREMAYGFATDEVLLEAGAGPWQEEMRRIQLLGRALRDFNVIHYNFGQTILECSTIPRLDFGRPWNIRHNSLVLYRYLSWMTDLAIMRLLNKVIVMTYQGDDARQGDYCQRHFDISPADHVDYYSRESDEWKRRAIRRVARYADRIYALNPDLLHVLPRGARFLLYASVDPREWTAPPRSINDVPIVLHAPTHRGAKGTQYVLRAAEELQREGVRFELLLAEHMPRDQARRIYERADFVVDQLLAGWYGAFAVEAMCLGKAVIAYIRQQDLASLPPEFVADLPIIPATPATVKGVMRDLLTHRRNELPELGRRARHFAEKWHDPRKIATQTVRDYEALLARRRTKQRFDAAMTAIPD